MDTMPAKRQLFVEAKSEGNLGNASDRTSCSNSLREVFPWGFTFLS